MGDRPLWSAEDQRGRLAELTANANDPARESPLRRDVRSLGTVLGRVLVEQVGESMLNVVEELRRLLIQHRERSGSQDASPTLKDSKLAAAHDIVSGLTIEDAH